MNFSETAMYGLAEGAGIPGRMFLSEHLEAEIKEATGASGKIPTEQESLTARDTKGGKMWSARRKKPFKGIGFLYERDLNPKES